MHIERLDTNQFENAKKAAAVRLALIHKKYPKLAGYLVLRRRGEQIELNSSLTAVF